jgi:hypothetical protein
MKMHTSNQPEEISNVQSEDLGQTNISTLETLLHKETGIGNCKVFVSLMTKLWSEQHLLIQIVSEYKIFKTQPNFSSPIFALATE